MTYKAIQLSVWPQYWKKTRKGHILKKINNKWIFGSSISWRQRLIFYRKYSPL